MRYYQVVTHESDGSFAFESEALLSSAEMSTVHYNYELADGYIARFFGKFKTFKTMNHEHPTVLLGRLQMRKNRNFRQVFESEFGINIPSGQKFKVRRFTNGRLPDSELDSELSDIDSDSEFEDGILPKVPVDLWNLLSGFSEALYA